MRLLRTKAMFSWNLHISSRLTAPIIVTIITFNYLSFLLLFLLFFSVVKSISFVFMHAHWACIVLLLWRDLGSEDFFLWLSIEVTSSVHELLVCSYRCLTRSIVASKLTSFRELNIYLAGFISWWWDRPLLLRFFGPGVNYLGFGLRKLLSWTSNDLRLC
jgi:hypothetical protein